MGNLSSINFKKSNAINTQHNDRTLPPSYLQVKEGGFEVNRSFEEAQALKEKIISEAIQKYTELTNQRFQGKSYEWSAVVNLKEDSTMQDLESLASYFQENYGFQCYQIAIHRDEGHIDENGKLKINHHAHLEFVMLDKDTGKTCFKMRDFTIKKMRELQTEVAEILGMERGVDKRISKTKRIEPRAYAKMKEREKDIKQEVKQAKLNRKGLIKEYTEQMKGKGFKQTDFQAMRGIANDEELESEEKIREQIKKFLEERAKEIEELNKEPEMVKIVREVEKPLTQEQIQEIQAPLKQELAQKEQELALEKQKSIEVIQNLEKENNSLKKRVNSLSKAIRNFKRRIREWWNKDKKKQFIKDTQIDYEQAVIGVAQKLIGENGLAKEFEIRVVELTDKEKAKEMRSQQRKSYQERMSPQVRAMRERGGMSR